MPIGIVYEGATGLVDPKTRPNVFRIAPTDHGIAFRLAEYLVPKGLKVALLTDDSGYGEQGRAALDQAFGSNPEAVARGSRSRRARPTSLRRCSVRAAPGATALLVWAQPPAIAEALIAARSGGWDVPVYTPPTGADPLVRQQLADRPSGSTG